MLAPRPPGLRRGKWDTFQAITLRIEKTDKTDELISLITISALLFLVSAETMHGPNLAAVPGVPPASPLPDLHAIKITRSGSKRITEGTATHFTGSVHIQQLFDPIVPSRTVGASVMFEAGARTVWHTHPLGQTLIVTAGVGWIQQWEGPIAEIQIGDVVWIPPGTKHWHGATSSSSMTHIAITEELNGKAVDWLEKVSDGEYYSDKRASEVYGSTFPSAAPWRVRLSAIVWPVLKSSLCSQFPYRKREAIVGPSSL